MNSRLHSRRPVPQPSSPHNLSRSAHSAFSVISALNSSSLRFPLPQVKSRTACTMLVQYKSIRINTCKSGSKQTALTFFRINTYAKTRGEGSFLISWSCHSSLATRHWPPSLFFQSLTNCPVCNYFVLITIQQWGGMGGLTKKRGSSCGSPRDADGHDVPCAYTEESGGKPPQSKRRCRAEARRYKGGDGTTCRAPTREMAR